MAQGTMQVTAMVAVCRAVTVTDKGCEHGSSRSVPVARPLSLITDPLLTSVMQGERPETWYLPGGNRTEGPRGPHWDRDPTVPGGGEDHRAGDWPLAWLPSART